MAEIDFDADKEAESTPGAGGGGNFSPAPRGIYTLQVADHSDGQRTQGGKNPGTPITKMTCEIADDGEHFGKRVWHNVTWIPRGTGEKANAGHGMAVHFLHAVGLPFDGKFKFAESDLQGRTSTSFTPSACPSTESSSSPSPTFRAGHFVLCLASRPTTRS